jgi:phosphatidylserine/phosphatidylglycerophosphate/cardiolipin synthase-like enzyme
MAKLRIACALAFVAGLLLAGCEPEASIPQGIQVYFSPKGGATEAVVAALDHATNAVLVQAYSFTSAPIAKALVEAHRRGVDVQVILDHSQRTEKYSEADFLKNSGIPTLIDAQHAIAHNKIMIIDGYVVLTGSFNFTKAAEEHNAENLLVINDPVLAKRYIENWHAHEQHSEPYERVTRPREKAGRTKQGAWNGDGSGRCRALHLASLLRGDT